MLQSGSGNIIIISALTLVFLLGTGCEKSIFFSSEQKVSKKIFLDPFGEMEVNDIFAIELRNDSVFSVELTGGKNLVDNISFSISENRLELKDNNSLKWLPDYPGVRLTVSLPDINVITLNAPARIFSADTLNVSSLSVISLRLLTETDLTVKASHIHLRTQTTDFGHYTFKGKSESSDLVIFGSAQLHAVELETSDARVRNYSTGDCYVHASNLLRVRLEHYGNIYYRGSPGEIIIERMNSRGRLIEINAER